MVVSDCEKICVWEGLEESRSIGRGGKETVPGRKWACDGTGRASTTSCVLNEQFVVIGSYSCQCDWSRRNSALKSTLIAY